MCRSVPRGNWNHGRHRADRISDQRWLGLFRAVAMVSSSESPGNYSTGSLVSPVSVARFDPRCSRDNFSVHDTVAVFAYDQDQLSSLPSLVGPRDVDSRGDFRHLRIDSWRNLSLSGASRHCCRVHFGNTISCEPNLRLRRHSTRQRRESPEVDDKNVFAGRGHRGRANIRCAHSTFNDGDSKHCGSDFILGRLDALSCCRRVLDPADKRRTNYGPGRILIAISANVYLS